MINQLQEKLDFEGCDPDSSPLAWNYYSEAYSKKFPKNFFENKIKNGNRFLSDFQYNYYNTKYYMIIGGDCDFNFNEKHCESFKKLIKIQLGTKLKRKYIRGELLTKRNNFFKNDLDKIVVELKDSNKRNELRNILKKDATDQEIIEIAEKVEKLLERIDSASKQHHTFLNFSLMPVTGGMNNTKAPGYDRLDRLVYYIDCYYKEPKGSVLMKRKNSKVLSQFLSNFEDVYDYCEKFYFLDRDMVDGMIKSGGKLITNLEQLESYLNLAFHYWGYKKNYLINKKLVTSTML